MGLFRVKARVAALPAGPDEEVELLVDTGATYTTVPREILARCGVQPLGSTPVKLADGRTVTKQHGAVVLAIDGTRIGSTVLFGEPVDLPLLGATALAEASLGVDPVGKRLIAVQALQA